MPHQHFGFFLGNFPNAEILSEVGLRRRRGCAGRLKSGEFQPSLAGLVAFPKTTQHCGVGYFQPSRQGRDSPGSFSSHVRWCDPDFLYATPSDSHVCGFSDKKQRTLLPSETAGPSTALRFGPTARRDRRDDNSVAE
jgi:hypothetical protein